MDLLFDSHGHHIATVLNRQLYNRGGRNIGQYLPHYGVFIDVQGRYLGEVVRRDRLLYNRLSHFCTTCFGIFPSYGGTIGDLGDLGRRAPIELMRGYVDIDPSRLAE